MSDQAQDARINQVTLTRRQIIKSIAAMSVVAPSALTLLSACGGSDGTASQSGVTNAPTGTSAEGPASTSAASPATQSTSATNAGGASSGQKTLTIAMAQDPFTLNPMLTTTAAIEAISLACLEKLLVFDATTMQPQPWLATSWEYTSPTTLRLHLRDGVNFSNGEPFDANAAKFSLETWAKAKIMAEDVGPLGNVSVSTPDDHTVEITVAQFAPQLLSQMARFGWVIPPQYYAKVGDEGFGKAPIGTGPFVFKSYEPANKVVFEKNPAYWRGARPFDTVNFRIVPEDISRAAAVRTGEADIAYYLSYDVTKPLESASDVNVLSIPGQRKFIAMFNPNMPGGEPLKDARVCVALNKAIDVDSIVKSVFDGKAVALGGQFVLPDEVGYNPQTPAFGYDPDAAKQLLADAGYANGFKMTFAYSNGRYPKDKEVGQIVASYLTAIGIDVEQKPLEWGEMVKERSDQTLGQIYQFGVLFLPDLLATLNYVLLGEKSRGGPMITLPKEWLDLYNQLPTASSQDELTKLYQQLVTMDHDHPFGIYLYAIDDFYATRSNVKGFTPRKDQFVFLYDVTIS